MLYQGFRNLALLSGFAWKEGDQWLLRQREPLVHALPFELGEGVREPGHREAVDLAGHLVMRDGRMRLLATFLDRASVTSFPRELDWFIHGVAPGEPIFEGAYVTKHWRDIQPGDKVDVSEAILATLRDRPALPEDLVRTLSRDPDMAVWCEGTQRAHRLTNFVMVTGMVGKIQQYVDDYVTPYYDVALQTMAPPEPALPLRLTQDVYALPRARRRLQAFGPIPATFTGTFLSKVKPNDDGTVKSITHYLRIADVRESEFDDFEGGIPPWYKAWRSASRPRATDMAAAGAA